ncbi:MAG: hypothetical protein SVU32_02395, partial [Candidatus Nanohaloarchaea archaeon]|nr:hypothetical protein [Candidatus Nanohaloarchaea archaeon]
ELPYTIFRPSIVFGDNDMFINLLIDQYKKYPVMPVLGDGSYRLQPIYVKDIAAIVHEALQNNDCLDQLFELGGPGIMTLEQIIDLIMDKHGKRKMKVYVPLGLAQLGSPVARAVMDLPLSRTTITMLKQENYVKEQHYTDIFDVQLHSLDEEFNSIYLD